MASAYLDPPSPRRRAIAFGLAVLVHILVVLLLLNLGPAREFVPMAKTGALETFDVAQKSKAPTPRPKQPRAEPKPPRAAAPPPPKPPVVFKDNSGVIWMTRDQFAKADIAKSGKLPARDAGEAQVADAGGGDSPTTGTGPNGQPLYAAEWYREPTSAELRTYLPPADRDSWGRIACRMVPEYRVENCQAMGESPLGSGIATGMRRASWQFRVRPPRVGGQPKYGTWVNIVITFTKRGPEARSR